MNDTPAHVKKAQLAIWLAKSPGERLYQAVKDNEELFLFFEKARLSLKTSGKTAKNEQQDI